MSACDMVALMLFCIIITNLSLVNNDRGTTRELVYEKMEPH